jgi:serine/threonine protein kinase
MDLPPGRLRLKLCLLMYYFSGDVHQVSGGAAHEKRIIHRDLKPADVMVAKDGRVIAARQRGSGKEHPLCRGLSVKMRFGGGGGSRTRAASRC